jgi:hypothetical protein
MKLTQRAAQSQDTLQHQLEARDTSRPFNPKMYTMPFTCFPIPGRGCGCQMGKTLATDLPRLLVKRTIFSALYQVNFKVRLSHKP